MANTVLRGLLAGAAGTTTLNALTYLDMALRGRPASSTPEQTVQRLEQLADVALAADDQETAGNRRAGIGPLLGVATGLVAGTSTDWPVPGCRAYPPRHWRSAQVSRPTSVRSHR